MNNKTPHFVQLYVCKADGKPGRKYASVFVPLTSINWVQPLGDGLAAIDICGEAYTMPIDHARYLLRALGFFNATKPPQVNA